MAKSQSFPIVHAQAAGIDIGAGGHWVCVGEDAEADVRSFGAFTADLKALADWLRERGVTHVAMEATGVYWIPLFELLEQRGLVVILVDPRQTRRAGRPKTDVLDCQWIRRLHACGLLTASFRPAEFICRFRSYLRRRLILVQDAGRYIQQMQKALDLMNIKLHQVVSDLTGKTGLLIVRSILGGERDPAKLARHRDRGCHADEATIARALEGSWRDEHLFALEQAVEAWDLCQKQIRDCDRKLHACLQQMPQKRPASEFPAEPRQHGRRPNEPAIELRPLLAAVAGVDLTAIEGIEATLAAVLLAEIGVDVSAWASEKHFGSWLGLAPRAKTSGKQKKRATVGPGASRAAWALRMAAWTLHRSQTALGGFFRRLKGRLGSPKAITATAYKLARLVYRMLKHGTAYVMQGLAAYEAQFRERTVKHLTKKARALGYDLVPMPVPTPS
jgi:transposase